MLFLRQIYLGVLQSSETQVIELMIRISRHVLPITGNLENSFQVPYLNSCGMSKKSCNHNKLMSLLLKWVTTKTIGTTHNNV